MTAAQVLELLTLGVEYELHAKSCAHLTEGHYFKREQEYERAACDCPGPDLLKEIKEVLKHAE